MVAISRYSTHDPPQSCRKSWWPNRTEKEIEKRTYEIWERKGKPEGRRRRILAVGGPGVAK
ncbi:MULTISPECIES: DUF2934 domain-containing protein [unclassified Bradyrhizobium]|uniref:DUF2934 domain-containing protein n=1 Tax=unclassified Bradyrhizobium TaxID=2631580 RepID=UPI00289CC495|nr:MULTISPECIES: DUF2934 domain-containing protein [unclassified Bradyrhizobium]